MGTNMKDVNLGVTLSPVYWGELPEYLIEFNGKTVQTGHLDKTTTFNWCLPAADKNSLRVHFLNKRENDTQGDKDKALVIDQLNIEGFTFYSFLMAGKYTPQYPEGYYQYAKERNLTVEPVITQTYLSFNGVWQLDFDWPVFTWIHKTENLGWLYDINI
jgi:hypothetical protein